MQTTGRFTLLATNDPNATTVARRCVGCKWICRSDFRRRRQL